MELSPKGREALWIIQFSARNRPWSFESMTGIKVPDGSGASFPEQMLMYGKEASNRKQEIDRQHHTIPNKRTKDKHYGNVHNRLWNHG